MLAGWTMKAGGLLGAKVRPSHSPPPSPRPGGQAARMGAPGGARGADQEAEAKLAAGG